MTDLDTVLAAVSDFVYTFDLEGRFTYANQSLHRLLQRQPGEMVGLNFHDLGYPEPLASTLQAQIQEVVDTKEMVKAETLFESAFGIGYYEYIFVPIIDKDGRLTGVAGTTRDITQRRHAEIALLESREEESRLVAELTAERQKLRSLFEQAPAFIATLAGPEFIFEFANEGYYRLIGRRDIIGKSLAEAVPEVVEQGFIDLLATVYESGNAHVGLAVPVGLSREGDPPETRFVDFIYQPVRDIQGEVTGILVHGFDVTDQVEARAEVSRLNAELESRVQERTLQLQLANRELEGFTYSVSHDLRSPLRAIIASSRILLEDYGAELDAEARFELERQAAAASKLAALIDDLLKLSRLARQPLNRTQVDVSQLAEGIATELAEHAKHGFCHISIEPDMTVIADATSLRLLLLNLIDNACKFSRSQGPVFVGSTRSAEETIFWVRDEGVGFDMAYADKIFLPFERLVNESDFPGTGIGLANVKRIVERHNGRVWVESDLGKGTTFFFTLGN